MGANYHIPKFDDFTKRETELPPRANYGSASVDLIVKEAVATERERCAKICDEYARTHTTTRKGEGARVCASLIRDSH